MHLEKKINRYINRECTFRRDIYVVCFLIILIINKISLTFFCDRKTRGNLKFIITVTIIYLRSKQQAWKVSHVLQIVCTKNRYIYATKKKNARKGKTVACSHRRPLSRGSLVLLVLASATCVLVGLEVRVPASAVVVEVDHRKGLGNHLHRQALSELVADLSPAVRTRLIASLNGDHVGQQLLVKQLTVWQQELIHRHFLELGCAL